MTLTNKVIQKMKELLLIFSPKKLTAKPEVKKIKRFMSVTERLQMPFHENVEVFEK